MLEAFGLSDPGCVRSNNEDYYLLAPALGLYLVADGMGGAQAGEHASKLAAETVGEFVYKAGTYEAGLLVRAFEEANRRVLEAANLDTALEGMGTTLVALLQANGDAYVTSVGDSRAYTYKDGQLALLTEDQTWVHEVGRRLGIEEAQLKSHPMRHVLTMAIGVSENLRTHSYVVPLQEGLQVLLCSDGLHGVISDQTIAGVLASDGELEVKAKKLIELARAAGGPDNITTVLLRVTAKKE
jgi:serine/threonine protein phosphatase PrpC